MTTPERGRDGLREAIEALIEAKEAQIAQINATPDPLTGRRRRSTMAAFVLTDDLRRILAEHPATGDGDRDEWCREESCEYRRWRSGDMPTHRRGGACPPASDVDSDNAAAGGAEGLTDEVSLARVVTAQTKSNRWRDLTPLAIARAILASGWLDAHVAQAKADERERIAQAIEAEASLSLSADPPTVYRAALLHAAKIARGES